MCGRFHHGAPPYVVGEPRGDANRMRMARLAPRKGASQLGVALNVSIIHVTAVRSPRDDSGTSQAANSRLQCHSVSDSPAPAPTRNAPAARDVEQLDS